jgi:hypothetical protein
MNENNNDNNVIIIYKTYTPAQKKANLKYKTNNIERINTLAKKYYDKNKNDPDFIQRKRESARKYYLKRKSKLKELEVKNE